MKSANVFNWAVVQSGQTLNANAKASGSKAGVSQTASMFASMMTKNYSTVSYSADGMAKQSLESTSEQTLAYDRYQYRDNSIESVQENPIADKIAGMTDELAGFEEEVTMTVAKELGLDEEQVTQVMEELGLTAFDLLDPQNLIQLTMELTGMTDQTELLMSPQFLNLLQSVNELGENLMEKLDVPMERMDEVITQANVSVEQVREPAGQTKELTAQTPMDDLIGQMDVLEEPVELTEAKMAQLTGKTDANAAELSDTVELTGTANVNGSMEVPDEAGIATEEGTTKETAFTVVSEKTASDADKEVKPDGTAVTVTDGEEPEAKDAQPTAADRETARDPMNQSEDRREFDAFARKSDSGASRTRQTAVINDQPMGVQDLLNEFKTQMVSNISRFDSSYLSIDTMDIIEQVSENLKLSVAEGVTSMEMQLNPENLGKIYLQISAKEGAVHAQIAAANEAVKNVLEAQVATLRENLNQAGVKVEAIEVTVASHEFERNLEQGQKREEQEGEQAQSHVGLRRRNLNLSSLDELSAVMTEEEALVAQIMRDNGNTVDLSA